MKKTTKAIATINAPAALIVTPAAQVMTDKELKALASLGIEANHALGLAKGSHGQTYAAISSGLRGDIATGVYSDLDMREYQRRCNTVLELIVNDELKDYKGADKADCRSRLISSYQRGIQRDNAKVLWVAPKSLKSQNEAHAKRESERASVNREVEKKVAAIVKKNPALADKEIKALKVNIKKEVTSVSSAARAEAKAANDEAIACTKYIEKLAAFSVQMSEVFSADVSQEQLKLASIIASLRGLINA